MEQEERRDNASSKSREASHGVGCTLETYSEHTQIPAVDLRRFGLGDGNWHGTPCVEMPYVDDNGVEVRVRVRVALSGDRFRWRPGDELIPYGVWRLREAREQGDITIVEGESDCQRLWHHGYPALGVPGAGSWQDEWAHYADDIEVIYVVIEPDRGGETLLAKLAASPLRDRIRVIRLDGHKDVLELHRADPDSFAAAFEAAMTAAVPLTDLDPEPPSSPSAIQQLFDEVGDPQGDSPVELEAYLDQLADAVFKRRHALEARRSVLRGQLTERLEAAGVRRPDSVAGELLAEVQARPEPKEEALSIVRVDPEIEEKAEKLLRFPNLLDFAGVTLTRRGLLGEDVNRRVVLLSAIGGLVGTAIHLAIKGASSGGKNTLVRSVLELLPPDAVLAVTGMSTHALEYRGGVIEGVIVIDEAEGQVDAEYQLRIAMSEGTVSRLTVNRSDSGRLAAQELEVEISASIITTTTAVSLHTENETRLLDLHIDDSEALTREVNQAAAEAAAGFRSHHTWREIEIWRAALGMLHGFSVMIPYAPQLAQAFPTTPLRARRDFKKLLALIENCALLHQRSRQQDDRERLIASIEDYAMVRPLVQAVLGPSMSGLSEKATSIYKLLSELVAELSVSHLRRIDLEREAHRRGIASPVTVQKWAQRLMELGFIEGHMDHGTWILVPLRDPAVEAIPLPNPEDLGDSDSS